ncbi:MAG TPA: YjfB family protein [bacterium]|nr:YjfB family protein [bacterium]HPN43022.1 YjfB family protein [bacterium]
MTNLASIAADMKAASVREQISMAVVKQTLDQSKQQANSLLKMMYQSNVNVAPKGHIDLYM